MPRAVERTPLKDYSVKELGPDTWKDFESFFSKYNGVQAGCWCMYYHREHVTPGKTIEEKTENNHREKEALVKSGKSRGVLIYADNSLVGSCQYGTREELPRPDHGRVYKTLERVAGGSPLWRITCFFVDRDYRRRGVASILLRETLSRIKEGGGGTVEAYPVTHWNAYSVWFGSLPMYQQVGFEVVAKLGRSNVLVRRYV